LLCYLRKGDRGKAEQTLAEMIEDRKRLPVSPVSLAWGFASLGDFDSAFEWLETPIRERDMLMPFVHVYTEAFWPALARVSGNSSTGSSCRIDVQIARTKAGRTPIFLTCALALGYITRRGRGKLSPEFDAHRHFLSPH